jgi:hypothetical protein
MVSSNVDEERKERERERENKADPKSIYNFTFVSTPPFPFNPHCNFKPRQSQKLCNAAKPLSSLEHSRYLLTNA